MIKKKQRHKNADVNFSHIHTTIYTRMFTDACVVFICALLLVFKNSNTVSNFEQRTKKMKKKKTIYT